MTERKLIKSFDDIPLRLRGIMDDDDIAHVKAII